MEPKDQKPNFVESERGVILDEPLPDAKPTPAKPAPAPKKHEGKIVGLILCILALGLLAFAMTQVDYVAITDTIRGNGYEAQGELADIIEQLQLTDDGMRILRATRPELQDRDAFNSNCTVELIEAVTLGCYSGNAGRIYVYNIQNNDLDGIRQSVLAHELLHAVWARLGEEEKSRLMEEMDKVYENNELVRKNMAIYENQKDYSELHSVIGQMVQPDSLTGLLRTHYARYFKDHAAIVAFYEKYSEPFERTKKRIEELKKEIADGRAAVDTMIEKYTADNDRMTYDVNVFNACSRQAGCFKSVEQFAASREELIAREEQLEKDYRAIQSRIEEINLMIAEYNENVIVNTELQESISSKSAEPESLQGN